MQHLDGKHALQLIRYRRYPEGDIQRVRVQQDFIRELIRQKLTPALINQAPDLFKEITRNVKTNFTVSDFVEYKDILTPLLNGDVKTYTLPGSAKYIDRISYFIADTEQARALIREHFSEG
ncbi:Transcriptional regulator LytR [bioreactor metagenome]|uniref:Transcriptional regulator LytR n=1 Tax=bioreactor metagenome TaxID=1076179 RepID=A0A645FA62_9ZZZZ